ncbi:MAG TPA: M24 family metallopeptidase [Actinomycetota bacterium]|nr:M24 family metallopeptidase [Actinomycetota bacterium]
MNHGPFAEPYPRFTRAEMDRRRGLLEAAMSAEGVTHLVVYGANRVGSAVGWLTNWSATREALVLVEPGERDVLLVQFYNHVPNAREVAAEADVRWGGPSSIATAAGMLGDRSARRVGTIGPLPGRARDALAAVAPVVELDRAYTEARQVKSGEEIDFLRVGARLTDAGMEALAKTARDGVAEHHLAAAVEAAYRPSGAVNHIHYFGTTPMSDPARCVPAQYQSNGRVARGDVLTAEISASYWDYAGQILRTFAVEAEPTPLYSELHEVAEAAFDAVCGVLRDGATCWDVVDSAGVIEDAGFTIYDDLLHGFGGGYLPPVLGTRSRTNEEVPDMRFRAGMTVVVQPNVITRDESAGVQTGELVLITEDGCEPLHSFERGFLRAPVG